MRGFREPEFPGVEHSRAWRELLLPELLGSRVLPQGFEELTDAYAGFPRGRISKVDRGRYLVNHGDDWQGLVKPMEILGPFGLTEKSVRWAFDAHERCNLHERELVRDFFRIKQTWPAEG